MDVTMLVVCMNQKQNAKYFSMADVCIVDFGAHVEDYDSLVESVKHSKHILIQQKDV